MRVALIDFGSGGGHHRPYARVIAQALRDAGHQPVAVGPQHWCEALSDVAEGAPIDWVGPGAAGYFERNREYRRFIELAMARCRERRVDVAHFLYIDGFIDALRRVGVPQDIKVVATLHWYPFLGSRWFELKGWFKGLLTLAWCRSVAHQGGKFVVHSRLAGHALARVGVVPAPAVLDYPDFNQSFLLNKHQRDEVRMRHALAPDDRLFLCFGGTRFDKGVDLAVRALAATSPRCHLLIAGTAQYFDAASLTRLAGSVGARERLHLELRYIADEEVASLFAAADVVLLPYRRMFKGQSGPLVTAAASGRPVIAADVPVLAETVRRFQLGEIVAAEDAQAFAGAMERMQLPQVVAPSEAFRAAAEPARFVQAMIDVYCKALIQ